MKSEFPALELIQESRNSHRGIRRNELPRLVLICHGCDDREAVIVGFLIHDQSERAWTLCGRV
jgi:hypothetical protein